jgi:hypothetical protein
MLLEGYVQQSLQMVNSKLPDPAAKVHTISKIFDSQKRNRENFEHQCFSSFKFFFTVNVTNSKRLLQKCFKIPEQAPLELLQRYALMQPHQDRAPPPFFEYFFVLPSRASTQEPVGQQYLAPTQLRHLHIANRCYHQQQYLFQRRHSNEKINHKHELLISYSRSTKSVVQSLKSKKRWLGHSRFTRNCYASSKNIHVHMSI